MRRIKLILLGISFLIISLFFIGCSSTTIPEDSNQTFKNVSLEANGSLENYSQKNNSLLCVGLDSDIEKLPDKFKKEKY